MRSWPASSPPLYGCADETSEGHEGGLLSKQEDFSGSRSADMSSSRVSGIWNGEGWAGIWSGRGGRSFDSGKLDRGRLRKGSTDLRKLVKTSGSCLIYLKGMSRLVPVSNQLRITHLSCRAT